MKRYQLVADVVIGVLLFAVAAAFTLLPVGSGVWGSYILNSRTALYVALALTAVFSAALAVRRLSPPIALGVAWVAAIVQMAGGLPPLPANFAIFGILYVTAAYGGRRLYWSGFASSLIGAAFITVYLLAPSIAVDGGFGQVTTYAFAAIMLFTAATLGLLLSWTIGALVRTAVRARENRAAQERAEAETATEQERTRIARDMHDVVAHSLAVVIAQADGARYAAAADPEAATAALATISSTARSALSDVRMLLTQLRHSQAEGPQPTLADLEELYAQVRAAGVDLRVDVDPASPVEPPAAVQLAVYRILQEALTNALRHGTGGPVDVTLAWHPDRVELTVHNLVADPAVAGGSGHGLIGMRERAQLVGGSMDAGADGGRFTVRVVIPSGAAAPGSAGAAAAAAPASTALDAALPDAGESRP
nr:MULTISPECIES: histidine kinase [Microbacterium]